MEEMCEIVADEIERKRRGINAKTQGQRKQQSLIGAFLFGQTFG
jgi:hypothetical protein